MDFPGKQNIDKKIIQPLSNLLLQNKKHNFNIKNIHGSLKSLIISGLYEGSDKNILVLCENNSTAEDFYHDFHGILSGTDIILLSEPVRKSKINLSEDDVSFWMIDSLAAISSCEKPLIIATADILNLNLPLPESINKNKIVLRKGSEINLENLTTELLLNGFERKDFVSSQGELALRGGILDIFPLDSNLPFRVEFFSDEIESIRTFNLLSQRSVDSFDSVEFIAKIYHSDEEEEFNGTLFNYINKDTIIFNDIPENYEFDEDVKSRLKHFHIIRFNGLGEADLLIKSTPQPNFNKSVKNMIEHISEFEKSDFEIHIAADGKSNLERIKELTENALEDADGTLFDQIQWLNRSFATGFMSETLRLVCYNEHEIFGRLRVRDRNVIKRKKSVITIKELKQLNIGDYVVHVDKGIASFDGLEIVNFNGKQHECVRLLFAGNDLLYLHLNYLHKIHKYNAEEGIKPSLSKLGSSEWLRKKKKTKKKLKDIARDLIKLYAERKSAVGFQYPEDTVWQKEFEASFIYEDTPDQEITTRELKQDLQSVTPMDRLVCGDVGYGKTEIAIRAAFKVVQAGKQVALLVPTTILAQQHYMSFKDRLHDYPVQVDAISRFRTTAEQKEILKHTAEGQTDILIGTHRLLSKDIKFKDLGLLIIDEEHRFGVSAKEKLKQLKTNLDTLTLTATPIPRTLNFSLMGARDLSIIETPPRNRLPVLTEILEWNDEEIKQIIEKEVKRGGQVFFVSDRVEDLELILLNLQELLPGLRFGLAHGQMPAKELERNMDRFIKGNYDVLVSTKIVESGLDIPTANTMIINRANKFGLAELYQLRGRVGRSNIQAFCFLIIPNAKKLSLNALKRLQAIEEFSDLGSGFQLALRDLEIRGAGNLLGPEQSGFINEMGFELYHKILDEAVKELREQEFPDLQFDSAANIDFLKNEEIQIDINSDAILPKDYVKSDKERFYYYKRLYNTDNQKDLSGIEDELIDRFGKLPQSTENLLFAVKLRIAALNTAFKGIELKGNTLMIEFPSSKNEKFYKEIFPDLIDVITSYENSILKQKGEKLYFEIEVASKDDAVEKLWRIKKTIESLV